MQSTLSDIVHDLDLQPGQVHREFINGFWTELRVLSDDGPTPGLLEQVMLNDWPSYRRISGGIEVHATPGLPTLPDPPVIPVDEVE